MRLLGNINHPKLLISVFKSGEKIIVKFEAGPMEQTYKFLETERIHDLSSVEKLITEEFYAEVFAIFDKMYVNYKKFLS